MRVRLKQTLQQQLLSQKNKSKKNRWLRNKRSRKRKTKAKVRMELRLKSNSQTSKTSLLLKICSKTSTCSEELSKLRGLKHLTLHLLSYTKKLKKLLSLGLDTPYLKNLLISSVSIAQATRSLLWEISAWQLVPNSITKSIFLTMTWRKLHQRCKKLLNRQTTMLNQASSKRVIKRGHKLRRFLIWLIWTTLLISTYLSKHQIS